MSWSIIRELKWTKDHDIERIRHYLAETYTRKKIESICKFAVSKREELQSKFYKDWLSSIPVSDDGWWDLTAEVVGRGRKFYETITVEKLIEMAKARDYVENFEYSFNELEEGK
jgi:hypothetical protein|tara:strand:- start:211 stop:552 length:342 start_codon:yes stop_codon:yes gene_type:complete